MPKTSSSPLQLKQSPVSKSLTGFFFFRAKLYSDNKIKTYL